MGHDPGQDADDDEIEGIDLTSLDLSEIDIEDEPGANWRWLSLVVLLSIGAFLLWLPTTEWFRMLGQDGGHIFVLAAVGIVVGILLGRWMWQFGAEAAERYLERLRRQPSSTTKPPSASRRWLMLIVGLGGAAAILYLPSNIYFQGGDHSQLVWFVAALGAVVVGVLLGRWLLLQAAASRDTAPSAPIALPPWFKWVTLSLLGGTGLVILVTKIASDGEDSGTLGFTLSAGGFVAGVGGAIWLARRFDEWEKKHAEQAREKTVSKATPDAGGQR